MKFGKLLAGLTLAAAVTSAQSAVLDSNDGLLTYTGPSFVDVATNNDFLDDEIAAGSQYGIGGILELNGMADLTFTYLGFEAGYDNDFEAYNNTFSNRGGNASTVGDSFSATADELVFSFYANNVNSGVENPNNPVVGNQYQSFAVMLDSMWDGVMYDAILLFDDSGAGPDDNHDDLVVGLNAVAVSEPATLALMGLGLLGLGAARRRQA
ncbi:MULTISPECIES: PEP-CTERM sorting domain-containing protein [unclassified Oleiphilus]|uniref:PEP-CTERM sorting domain-containing protein n=3 Tax=Oleiphilus TaxID=141450 RepID=UPI0007C39740|nr:MULTISPECIES: PEP-CTERM sorting domain-containing protein [unclassified Oleiphilus]KZY61595.1 hypothetical protein A3738_13645 [Oleiphilus sp. HI0066]KZY77255.1 hypothetical protein A3739_13640 [Oleiphilus sp. HI0067]